MTVCVIEIDKEWVYLEVDRQIKFKARYCLKKGSRNPGPGSNVRFTFIRPRNSLNGHPAKPLPDTDLLVELIES